jgi:stress responsive alpha/beta barrel protein
VTLQHIVLFSFPEELSAADAKDMRDQVASWATEIATMSALRFGTDLTGARTRGYQYLLYMEFADTDALKAYQAHPVHQRFLAWITERNCTPLAFDYYLDHTTVLAPEPALTSKEPT